MAYQTNKIPLRYGEDPEQKADRQLRGAPVEEGPGFTPDQPNSQAPTGDQGGGNGRWVNFSRYWDQNRNGAGDMANALTTRANERAGSVQAQTAQALQQFGQAVNAGTVRNDGSDISNAQYAGPTSLTEAQGYGDLDAQALRATENVDNLQRTEGVQAELQDMYGGQGSYSTGASLLDAGLASTAGGAQFAGVKKNWGGLLQTLTSAKNEAAKTAGVAQSTSDLARAEYLRRLLAGEPVAPVNLDDPDGRDDATGNVYTDPSGNAATSDGVAEQLLGTTANTTTTDEEDEDEDDERLRRMGFR